MPDSCCVVGCANRRSFTKFSSFYRISNGHSTKEFNRQQLWLNALHRENWPDKMIKNARVCSKHFVSGKRSDEPNHPDYVPSVFMYKPNSSGHKRLQLYQRYQSQEKKQKTFSGDNIFNEQSAYVETEEYYTQNIPIEESMFSENEKFSGNSTEESVLFKSVGIQCDLSMEELLKEENQKISHGIR
ncbi:uncharacterized protein LOC124814176 isoform X2 [Hydra vulgaris]|uniref:Uncharacterized protein LOC124814176 isoform X2 n=1 Tax=Hydra vulgaris TaxID=6087 RepID=A0ABM4CUK6_HYDVU